MPPPAGVGLDGREAQLLELTHEGLQASVVVEEHLIVSQLLLAEQAGHGLVRHLAGPRAERAVQARRVGPAAAGGLAASAGSQHHAPGQTEADLLELGVDALEGAGLAGG